MAFGTRGKRLKKLAAAAVVLAVLAALLAFLVAPRAVMAKYNHVVDPGPYAAGKTATELHATLLVADCHADALMWSRDLLKRGKLGHVDLPRLQEGNVALQVFTVPNHVPRGHRMANTPDNLDLFVPLSFFQAWPARTWFSPYHRALYQANRLAKTADRSGGQLRVIHTHEDLARFLEDRRADPTQTAGLLGIEGMYGLGEGKDRIRDLFHAGFRLMAPVHFPDGPLGGSRHGMVCGGLTDFGREALAYMEELKVIVDLSHASGLLINDVLDAATRPPLVSHTGPAGLCDTGRGLTDDQMERIAAAGGVIGIGFWPKAVCGDDAAAIAKAIRYTADLVGVGHVGLGSDYDGSVTVPFDVSGMVLLTEALLDEGFGEDDVAAIMGGNLLRFLRENLPGDTDAAHIDEAN